MDHRKQIKEILINNDRTVCWLEKKTGIKDLHYILGETSKNFDIAIFEKIMNVFRVEGFILSEADRSNKFSEQLISVNGIIGHSVHLLNSTAKEYLKDHVLDFKERRDLYDLITKIKADFNTSISEVERIIEG